MSWYVSKKVIEGCPVSWVTPKSTGSATLGKHVFFLAGCYIYIYIKYKIILICICMFGLYYI